MSTNENRTENDQAAMTTAGHTPPGEPAIPAATDTHPTSSIREAIEKGIDGEIPITDDLVAVISPMVTGIYRQVFVPKYENGVPVKGADGRVEMVPGEPQLVVPWVAWRSRAHIDEVHDERLYDITLIRPDGRKFVATGLTDAESLDPNKVRSKIDAGVPLPKSDRKAMEDIANALDILGRDEREEEVLRRYTGWTQIDGRHYFLMPQASMTADGPVKDVVAAFPRGVSKQAAKRLKPAVALSGWTSLPESRDELLRAAGAIKSLINITPKRPEVMISALGSAFAALLGAEGRAMVVVVGVSDSGKSQLAAAIQTLWSAAPRSGKNFPVDAAKDTTAYAMIWAQWTRHLMILADDARTNTESQRSNEKSAALVTELTQGVFGAGVGGRATNTGEVRRGGQIESPGLLTAERLSSQTAIRNRSIVLHIEKGDIGIHAPSDDKDAPIDAYTEQYHHTGLARKLFGTYAQFLAKNLDGRGELAPSEYGDDAMDAMVAWAERERTAHFKRYNGNRAAETAAYSRLGWEAAFKWAETLGIRDFLPTAEEVDAAILKVVQAGIVAAEESDPGAQLLERLANRIESGKTHLAAYDAGRPDRQIALASGWRVGNAITPDDLIPNGQRAGMWTRDYKYVVINKQAFLDTAKADTILGVYKADEIETYVRQHCDPDLSSAPGTDSKVSTKLELKTRPRGYVFTPDQLGLQSPVDDAPATAKKRLAPLTEEEMDELC